MTPEEIKFEPGDIIRYSALGVVEEVCEADGIVSVKIQTTYGDTIFRVSTEIEKTGWRVHEEEKHDT